MTEKYRLTFSCPDQTGIVARITGALFDIGANIYSAQQFKSADSNRFFMRVVFDMPEDSDPKGRAEFALASLHEDLSMEMKINRAERKKRVIICVSKFDHCLVDLLYRARTGELPMDIVGIVSNHSKDALSISNYHGVPFHHLPITKKTKPEQEAKFRVIINDTNAELVVLARYMQILSDGLAQDLAGKCINIHHSFLPGFKGARPYHQAYARGVKMIGATAHFVTPDLDEGPIIAQDVEQISHKDHPDDLIRKGRNIEQRVLARAVSYFLEDRLLLNGSKTVVFV